MWFLGVTLALAWIGLPLWSQIVAMSSGRELARPRERVQQLEASRAAAPVAPSADPIAMPPPPVANPAPFTADHTARVVAPVAATGAHGEDPPHPPARRFFDSAHAEELVGGHWLQNVGAASP